MQSSLPNKAVKGVVWSAVERFSVQGIQFILSMIIARLVDPSEYGLIAMLAIFLAIAQIFVNSGFAYALIQKKDRSETDFSTVFYFNIVIALFVYILLYGAAPFIAAFYEEPLLIVVTRWIGLNIIISAFSIVQRAKLTLLLDFKTQAKASLLAVIFSGIAGVVLAYYGYGVWALVVQALASNFINTFLLWIFSPWFPLWIFSWQSFRRLFSFGSKLLLSGLLHTIYINLYSLVIGKKYSATDVGYYNRAYSLAQFPSVNITDIITRAIYPVQCELQDKEERLTASFIQYLRMSCFIIFPLMIGLAIIAKPLIVVLLTEKWGPAAELLSILCIAYMWYPIMVINNQILNVKGRSDYFLKAEIIKKVIAIGILILTLPLGLRVLCWGVVLYNLLDCLIIIHYAKKVIQTSYRQQLKNVAPLLLLNAAMGLLVCLSMMLSTTLGVQVITGILSGVLSYVGMSYLFRIKELDTILETLKLNTSKYKK